MSFFYASLLVLASAQTVAPMEAKLVGAGSADAIVHGYQRGGAVCDTLNSKLEVHWSATPLNVSSRPYDWSLPFDPVGLTLDGNAWSDAIQVISLQCLYPTAVCVLDKNEALLIGGIDKETRETVIQKMTLGWPTTSPQPITKQETGVSSVAISFPSPIDGGELYREDIAGRRHVVAVVGLRREGRSMARALVLFNDSNDLYTIDLQSGQLELVASSTLANGQLGLLPALSSRVHHGLWFGDRSGVGYTYALKLNDWAKHSPIILADTDKDGTLDVPYTLTDTQLVSGLGRSGPIHRLVEQLIDPCCTLTRRPARPEFVTTTDGVLSAP